MCQASHEARQIAATPGDTEAGDLVETALEILENTCRNNTELYKSSVDASLEFNRRIVAIQIDTKSP